MAASTTAPPKSVLPGARHNTDPFSRHGRALARAAPVASRPLRLNVAQLGFAIIGTVDLFLPGVLTFEIRSKPRPISGRERSGSFALCLSISLLPVDGSA